MPGRYTEGAFIQGWPLRGVPLNTEVAFIEGLFGTQTVHLGPGLYITVVLSSAVAVNRFYLLLHVGCVSNLKAS